MIDLRFYRRYEVDSLNYVCLKLVKLIISISHTITHKCPAMIYRMELLISNTRITYKNAHPSQRSQLAAHRLSLAGDVHAV